jgi:hypothetical protein
LLEGCVNLTGDAMLGVEFETEETADCDDDGGHQADQGLYHWVMLRLPIVERANCHIVGSEEDMNAGVAAASAGCAKCADRDC